MMMTAPSPAGDGSTASADDDGYSDFFDAIDGDSSSAEPPSSSWAMRRRRRSKYDRGGGDDGGIEAGSLVAPSAPHDDGRGSLVDGDAKQPPVDDEIITIPESTHSFLFTEPVGSLPFLFAVGIASVSVTCLALALANIIRTGGIPQNVDFTVKIAQYLAIIVLLLMEEEIPTGLYLLRRIPMSYLKETFPETKYSRFVASAVLRILMGYLFLAGVIVVLITADGVIDIFYDVLALQFIQQLDDIAFGLSKMDVLGKRLQRATRSPVFQFEFAKQKKKTSKFQRLGIFLKAIYFANLLAFLSVMIYVTVRQMRGDDQCEEITFKVGDNVWDKAFVNRPDGHNKPMKLIYSYFNGVYYKKPGPGRNGRPVYVEQRKTDHLPFEEKVPPSVNEYIALDPVEPSEIWYCGGRWIFTNEQIYKSEDAREEDCPWLIRSSYDEGFDVLEVTSNWELWTGVITDAEVFIKCSKCTDSTDCNLQGRCTDGECVCNDTNGTLFLGIHCETKVKDGCRTIISEVNDGAWSVGKPDWTASNDEIYQLYSRPAYEYQRGTAISNNSESSYFPEPQESDSLTLVYQGLRWFVVPLPQANDPSARDQWQWLTGNYHGFWSGNSDFAYYVSDPTTGDSPVGVDFYQIRERGPGMERYGPYGLLVPMQPTGRGLFRCEDDAFSCSFCSDGLSVPKDKVVDHVGTSCGFIYDVYALGLQEGGEECKKLQMAEPSCCPKVLSDTGADMCGFCSDGITAEESYTVPESDGRTCSSLSALALSLLRSDDLCEQLLLAEDLCCPITGEGTSAEKSYTPEELNSCLFCMDGITAEENYIVPESGGQTCNGLQDYALTFEKSDGICNQILQAEGNCCPTNEGGLQKTESAEESDVLNGFNDCTFCLDGIKVEQNLVVPDSGGQTCHGLKNYALTLKQKDNICMQIQLAEEVCCSVP